MVEVRRVSDRVMTVVVAFEADVLRLICGYVSQWKKFGRKTVFYYELKCEWFSYVVV